MNQVKASWSHSPKIGIKNRFKILKPQNNTERNLSPKEVYRLREKELRLKLTLFILLNNFIWLFVALGPSNPPPVKKKLEVAPGHEIIKIPAEVFTQTPQEGQKAHIHLKHTKSGFRADGFLRSVEADPHSPSGTKVLLEIKIQDLSKLNGLSSHWQVYPYFKEARTKKKKNKRSLYEVTF